MANFFKGIIVGLGGIAPGLSGSVLLIIFGLYRPCLDALGTLFRDFKKKVTFLLPLAAGIGVGVLLFSKLLNFLLTDFEVPTRFCFLGLILGTVPLFYGEVKKKGFSKKYYILILLAMALGTWMFTLNGDSFPQRSELNLPQCIFLGFAVAATAIVPGVDPAVFLSSLGIYEVYVRSLATLDLSVLAPMAIGLAVGAVCISFCMSFLFRRFYTVTYSLIFGLFLSMIPNMLNEKCTLGWNWASVISIILLITGFLVSYFLGKLEDRNKESTGRNES